MMNQPILASGTVVNGTGAQALQQTATALNVSLTYYSNWGVSVGVGMFACVMFASLLGHIVRRL